VPALYMLGVWILIQLVSSVGTIARTSDTGGGGVAYLAHVGGFVAGLLLVRLIVPRDRRLSA
jgi:membrane associated rhomboid family serine protease